MWQGGKDDLEFDDIGWSTNDLTIDIGRFLGVPLRLSIGIGCYTDILLAFASCKLSSWTWTAALTTSYQEPH
jgi:hypothetical protein